MDEILRLLGTLLVTVGILVLAFFCTRMLGRWGSANKRIRNGSQHIRILEQLSIGKDQKLMVVQLNERYLLLGVSAGAISTLAELTAEEAACWKASQTEEQSPLSFKEALRAALHKEKK